MMTKRDRWGAIDSATFAAFPPCARCSHTAAQHDAPGTECVVADCMCPRYVRDEIDEAGADAIFRRMFEEWW